MVANVMNGSTAMNGFTPMNYRSDDQVKRRRTERDIWVTHHAVKRFRQRVLNIPIRESRRSIINMLTASVEVRPTERYLLEMPRYHQKPGVRYFRARFESIRVIIVVCRGIDAKFVVVTVKPMNPHYFILEGGKRYGERLE